MDKLVFKVRSEKRYAGGKFPLKTPIFEDELLSSWLIRLALLHRTAPVTFTNLYLPDTKNRLWYYDMDLRCSSYLLAALRSKTNLPLEALRDMTLKSFEGFLFEEAYGRCGGTRFLNPLGMRGGRSTLPGLRYCPVCLREDQVSYFRKKWRLAISVVCPTHQCYLLDRCSSCNTPLTPYLASQRGGVVSCYKCSFSIVEANSTQLAPVDERVITTIKMLYEILDTGFKTIAGTPVYSHLYFEVLHQILKLMMSRKNGVKLAQEIDLESSFAGPARWNTFEKLPLHHQAQMLVKVVWLLEDWPDRFVAVCRRANLLSSPLLQDLHHAPFWYCNVVVEALYHPDRVVAEEEIRQAMDFMKSRGICVTEVSLSKLLGVKQIFRKRKIKLLSLLSTEIRPR